MMTISKPRIEVEVPGWNHEKPTTYFSQPYGILGGLEWIYHVLVNPPKKPLPPSEFIPAASVMHAITPKLRLGFIGDLMMTPGMDLLIREEIKGFFSDVDYLVGNFEGTLVAGPGKRVFMAQVHEETLLDSLADLFPPGRTILSCANNHSGDFGWKGFSASYRRIEDRGFITMGRRDEGAVLIGGKVNIAACTRWSNQKCDFVAVTEEAGKYFSGQAEFNILYPHWGYEMQLRPKPHQVREAETLLRTWDMMIGHHSHCPQPIVAVEGGRQKKLLAYSLGNFCSPPDGGKVPIGMILKVELGPDETGRWAAGRVDWQPLTARNLGRRGVEIAISTG